MQPEDFKVRRAKKVVDAGMNIPLAQLTESIQTNEKLDALLAKESIEIPPFPGLPEYPTEISVSNLPEIQKVLVTNFPEQKAPVVNIAAPKAPIVNVEAPIVEMNNEEVVAELKNISDILSKEEVEGVDKTEIVDEKGDTVNFKKMFDSLADRIGNIRVTGGGAGFSAEISQSLDTLASNYATQIDDTSTASVTYIGKAAIGSSSASALWQIQKIDESASPTTITWADGNDLFDNIWDNRLTLNYL